MEVLMTVTIEYCTQWNYQPRAAGLAAKLQQQLNATVTLIPSSGGVYEIVVDGHLVYSKKATGEFPDEQQLLKQIAG